MHPSYSASFPYCSKSASTTSWESHRLIYEQHGNDDNHDEEKKRLIYTQTSYKKTRYILCKKNSLFSLKIFNMYMDHEYDEFLCDAL